MFRPRRQPTVHRICWGSAFWMLVAVLVFPALLAAQQPPEVTNALPPLADSSRRPVESSAVGRALYNAHTAVDAARWVSLPAPALDDTPRLTWWLSDLRTIRSRAINPALERLWMRTLERLETHALANPQTSSDLADLLLEVDPMSPAVVRIRRTRQVQRIEQLLQDGQYDDVISQGAQYRAHWGQGPEVDELLRQARYGRALQRWNDGRPWNAATVIDLWYTAVEYAGAADMPGLPTPGQLVETFFASGFDHSGADLENFVGRVGQYARSHGAVPGIRPSSLGATRAGRLAGRAEYLAAAHIWREHGAWTTDTLNARREMHLFQAREWGYVEDPERLRLRRVLGTLWPALIPSALLAALTWVAFRRSLTGQRWRYRRLLRRAWRLRRAGSPMDAAAQLVLASRLLERLSITGDADFHALASVYRQLMLDAMERNRPSEGAVWAEKLRDLPAEFWPQGFVTLARRCGLVVT